MGNGTHENLLHEQFLTRIINKICNEVYYTCTCNTNFEGRIDLKGLLSTSIASAITAAERLLEEMALDED